MNKPKIKISEKAYYEIIDMIKKNPEYTHMKISHNSKCCGTKVDFILDNDNEGLIEDFIEDLKILYSNDFLESVQELIVTFEDNSFKAKIALLHPLKKSCTGGCCKASK